MPAPPVRVIVRLPYNRPHSPDPPIPDPPRVEWTQEKADILWKVIERARSSENAGTDWKGLASHLEVQLPYLLYRVNARFQEDIRGLKDIQGAFSPAVPKAPAPEGIDDGHGDKGNRATNRLGASRLISSVRLTAPLGVRTRINSVGHNSRPRNPISASTATLRSPKRYVPMRPATPSSSEDEGTDSEEEIARKEEEAERKAEEQELLDNKLKELQRMMTNDTLGLVSAPPRRGKRGRTGVASPSSLSSSSRHDTLSSRSNSQSVSSVNSPQGSIPEIPSSPQDSQSLSPGPRSPGPSSPRRAFSPRYGHLGNRPPSEYDSIQGSETSSLSDFSDSSLLASGLDSPSFSGVRTSVRGAGSRVSQYSRNRAAGRTSGFPL